MTYCVGLMLDAGIVLLSDTRTNAGLDNVSTYRKMFTFQKEGERVIALMTAGSLSVTQGTIARLRDAAEDGEKRSIMSVGTMLEVVQLIGDTMSEVAADVGAKLKGSSTSARAGLIVAGQRRGGPMRMFLVYPQGNFIEATRDTPFLQIGEHKYGKPILDRVVRPETSLADAQKAALLSMDSTLRSNLSVGMPLDLAVIEKDRLAVTATRRIEPEDEAFAAMSQAWSAALRRAYTEIDL